MNELAVKFENVYKEYRLGAIGGRTFQEDIQSYFAKKRGKDDPNLKIGQTSYEKNERFNALTNINIEIKKGEKLGIIGLNGAGKSTLLKILSRVTSPTDGTVYINGRISSMLEVGTGFNRELTGRENIYLNGAILGMKRSEVDCKIEKIIEFSECEDFIDTPVKRYSSGMYVKLAFSVAAHLDSDIVVMDEVLAVGDAKFQQKCLDKMNEIADNEGRTIIYVSHNMGTIRELCAKCIVLKKGEISYEGNVDEAINIYLDSIGELSVIYDYTEYKRSMTFSKKMEFLGMDIINKKESRFETNEKFFAILHCKANEDEKGILLQTQVVNSDRVVAGSMCSDKAFNIKAGQRFDMLLKFNTEHLVPGKYLLHLIAYTKHNYNKQLYIDRVAPAIIFEITEPKSNDTWIHQKFGHVRFENIEIEAIKEIKNDY